MEEQSRLPFPLYDPTVAAKTILYSAEHPRRDLIIGGSGKMAILGEKFLPWFTDFMMKRFLFGMQKTRGPRREVDSLHETPRHQPRERGEQDFYVAGTSIYTWTQTHRQLTAAIFASLAAAAMLAPWRTRMRKRIP